MQQPGAIWENKLLNSVTHLLSYFRYVKCIFLRQSMMPELKAGANNILNHPYNGREWKELMPENMMFVSRDARWNFSNTT